MAEARRLHCEEVHLDSGVQRHDAHRFYLAHGMRISGRLPPSHTAPTNATDGIETRLYSIDLPSDLQSDPSAPT